MEENGHIELTKDQVQKLVEKDEDRVFVDLAKEFQKFNTELREILKAKNDIIKKGEKLKDLPRFPVVAAYEGVFKRAYAKGLGASSSTLPDSNVNGRTGRGRATEQERQHDDVGRGELTRADGETGTVADSNTARQQNTVPRRVQQAYTSLDGGSNGRWWANECGLGRVAPRNPHRVDRLKALGNGIVPAVVAEFLRRLA